MECEMRNCSSLISWARKKLTRFFSSFSFSLLTHSFFHSICSGVDVIYILLFFVLSPFYRIETFFATTMYGCRFYFLYKYIFICYMARKSLFFFSHFTNSYKVDFEQFPHWFPFSLTDDVCIIYINLYMRYFSTSSITHVISRLFFFLLFTHTSVSIGADKYMAFTWVRIIVCATLLRSYCAEFYLLKFKKYGESSVSLYNSIGDRFFHFVKCNERNVNFYS